MPSRPAYWEIQPLWLFYGLAGVALAIFALGAARRWRAWRRGAGRIRLPHPGRALVWLLRDGLLGARLFRGAVVAGLMHLTIAWGFSGLFIGTVLVALDHYVVGFLAGRTYLAFAAAMELCGVLLVGGAAWALARRYLQRLPRLTRRASDLLPALWLLVLGGSGFLLEGARLAAQQPPWASVSVVGAALQPLWPAGEAALGGYRALWWGHALLSLAFVAYLPWSKLLHLLVAPAAVALQEAPLPEPAEDAPPEQLAALQVLRADACTTCGRCVEACPSAAAGEPLSPRDCAQAARGGTTAEPRLRAQSWYCTTCGACARACPVTIRPHEVIAQSRRALIEAGADVPPQLAETLERLHKYHNPWIAKKGGKAAWQAGRDLPDLSAKGAAELLYFVGCTTAIDTRAQGIAGALAAVLAHAGVSFGTLGKKEPCCGDIARRAGELGLFEEQQEQTRALFDKHSVVRVVSSSPHCADTLRGAPGAGAPEVLHYTELLARLIATGELRFPPTAPRRVTYHDPCFLARHNGIVEAPRRVIRATGAELVEIAPHGAESLCCGGGGGRMWHELAGQGPLAERRLRQAVATGAELLVTACPLCLIMLEDARKTGGLEDRIAVIDLAELAARALGPPQEG